MFLLRVYKFGSVQSALRMRWPEYWSFSFSISPSNEYSGLISFRMDLLDLLAVQGTLRSLLQHHNSKASILRCSAFFTVQLSHRYMTVGKTIALTRRTFVGKVMTPLFILFPPPQRVLIFYLFIYLFICFPILYWFCHTSILICCLGWPQLFFQGASVVFISSNFGAPRNKVCQCFDRLPIYLP